MPSGSQRRLAANVRAADVGRTLLRAAELVDAGVRIVLDKEGDRDISHLYIKSTGEEVPIERKNQVYGMTMDLDGAGAAPFGRRGQRL